MLLKEGPTIARFVSTIMTSVTSCHTSSLLLSEFREEKETSPYRFRANRNGDASTR